MAGKLTAAVQAAREHDEAMSRIRETLSGSSSYFEQLRLDVARRYGRVPVKAAHRREYGRG